MSEETKVSEAEVKAADPAPAQTSPNAPEQDQGPDLTVQDLQALKSIIDVASQRGAFKPNEMVTVGQTYNKLEVFLAAVTKQQPSQGA